MSKLGLWLGLALCAPSWAAAQWACVEGTDRMSGKTQRVFHLDADESVLIAGPGTTLVDATLYVMEAPTAHAQIHLSRRVADCIGRCAVRLRANDGAPVISASRAVDADTIALDAQALRLIKTSPAKLLIEVPIVDDNGRDRVIFEFSAAGLPTGSKGCAKAMLDEAQRSLGVDHAAGH